HPWTLLANWEDFGSHFGRGEPDSYLASAVRGFFQNGGRRCYVMPLSHDISPQTALADRLAQVSPLQAIDLVCGPDIMRHIGTGEKRAPVMIQGLQALLLARCDQSGDRFAILDSPRDVIRDQAGIARSGLVSENGAMYCPWVRVDDELGEVKV